MGNADSLPVHALANTFIKDVSDFNDIEREKPIPRTFQIPVVVRDLFYPSECGCGLLFHLKGGTLNSASIGPVFYVPFTEVGH